MKPFAASKKQMNNEDLKGRKTRSGIFSIYQGIKINWFKIILGAIISIVSTLVLFCAATEYYDIANGTLESLKPLWKYTIFAFGQYFLLLLTNIMELELVRVVTQIRKKLWKKMVCLPMKDYDEASPKGMLSRLTYDADFASTPIKSVVLIINILLSISSLFAIFPDTLPSAGPMIIVMVILSVILVAISLKVISSAQMALQNRISALTAHYVEQFSNIKFVKATNTEQKSIQRSSEFIEKRYQAAKANAMAKALEYLSKNCVYIIMYVTAFLGGIIAIASGQINSTTPVQDVYAYFAGTTTSYASIIAIPTSLANAVGGYKKLSMLMKGEVEDKNSGEEIKEDGDIVLNNVNFAYSDTPVLNNLSVILPQGKVTAIVGCNGCGKTTLTKIIDRLYPMTNGELRIGENNAEIISLQCWRDQFGIVSQKAQLFEGSIRQNIAYGLKEELSEEKLAEIIHKARLDEVVERHGLDGEIGVSGAKLSGGEQQRLAIARALAKDPKILILDEATANLDSQTEQEVKEGLKELMKGRTVIMIAHNYSAIKDADQIIVMNEGTISDCGNPQELLGRNGYIQAMRNEALAG